MNRNGHKNVEYFLGPEVEHTPAHSKRTLFVVGYQDPIDVLKWATEMKAAHVYLGANHSFDPEVINKSGTSPAWEALITNILDRGLFVTIDYEAHKHETVLKMFNAGIWQSRLFIPMLSVRIPKVQTSHTNLTIKIDDIDFNATNEGVWCMNYREVTDSNRFTPWQDYSTDQILSAIETISEKSETKVVKEPERKVYSIDTPNLPKEDAAKYLKDVADSVKEKNLSPDINDGSLGIDPVPTTALKPDTQETKTVLNEKVNTSSETADAYATAANTAKKGKK